MANFSNAINAFDDSWVTRIKDIIPEAYTTL
jgi:hypothetical protein